MDWLHTLFMLPFALPFVVSFVTMCCCTSNCTNACTADAEQYQITITAIANTVGCLNCTSMNATWTASATTTDCGGATLGLGGDPAVCYRKSDQLDPDPCGHTDGVCFLMLNTLTGGNYFTQVEACWRASAFDNRDPNIRWSVNHGATKPDCSAFSSLALSLTFSTGECNAASSTCAVSAV